MKILIKDFKRTEETVSMMLRIEQEPNLSGYENSIGPEYIEFDSSNYSELSDDEFMTMAFNRLWPVALKIFKQTGYLEEPLNPVEFELIESTETRIIIDGPLAINKFIGHDKEELYSAIVIDQYKKPMRPVALSLDGVVLENGILTISEDVDQVINLVAVDGEFSESLELTVMVVEKELTETEELASLVTTLALDSIEKQNQIEALVGQITNIMLGGA